jgi:hypothetical protein
MSIKYKLWTIVLMLSTVVTVFLFHLAPRFTGTIGGSDVRIASGMVLFGWLFLIANWVVWFFSCEATFLGKRLYLLAFVPLLVAIFRLVFLFIVYR